MEAYWKESEAPSFAGERHLYRARMSVCRVYSSCPTKEFNFDSFAEDCLKELTSCEEVDVIVNLSHSLAKCKWKLKEIEDVLLIKLQSLEDEDLIKLGNHLIKCFCNGDKGSKRTEILMKMAAASERLADLLASSAANPFQIVDYYKNAMEYWRISNAPNCKEERARIAKKLQPVEKQSLDMMQSVEIGPIDITPLRDSIKASLEKASFEEVIWQLANLTNLETVQSTLELPASIFADLVEVPVLNNEGRTVCIVPPRPAQCRKRIKTSGAASPVSATQPLMYCMFLLC